MEDDADGVRKVELGTELETELETELGTELETELETELGTELGTEEDDEKTETVAVKKAVMPPAKQMTDAEVSHHQVLSKEFIN